MYSNVRATRDFEQQACAPLLVEALRLYLDSRLSPFDALAGSAAASADIEAEGALWVEGGIVKVEEDFEVVKFHRVAFRLEVWLRTSLVVI